MGHPEKSAVTGKDGSGTGPAGGAPMSPVRAFLLLLALLVLAGVVLLMTTRPERAEPIQMERPQGAGDKQETQEKLKHAKSTPTNTQATQALYALQGQLTSAYRERKPKMAKKVFAPQSERRRVAIAEIRRLRRDSVLDRTRYTTRRLRVTKKTPDTLRIRQVVVVDPHFIAETGVDVTVGEGKQRQVIDWTLRRSDQAWLILDGIVLDSREAGE